MKTKSFIIIAFAMFSCFVFTQKAVAQSLPSGACGIVYTYDAAGNRTGYQYICNNNSVAGVKQQAKLAKAMDSVQALQVNTLYPNPTTGMFTIKMAQPLNNAAVTIMNAAGHTVLRTTATGSMLQYNLSGFAPGLYIVHIVQGQQKITMKLMKH